ANRRYFVHLHGVEASSKVTFNGDVLRSRYDADTETLHISALDVGKSATLVVKGGLAHRNRKQETVLHMLRFFKLHAGVRNRIAEEIEAIINDPANLAPYIITLSVSQGRALFETLYEAGVHAITDTDVPAKVVFWNNHANPAITYRYSDIYLHFGF